MGTSLNSLQALQYWTTCSVPAFHNSISYPSMSRNYSDSGLFDTYRRKQNDSKEYYVKRICEDKCGMNIFAVFTAACL